MPGGGLWGPQRDWYVDQTQRSAVTEPMDDPSKAKPPPSTSSPASAPFWEAKTLDEMSSAEWESLCDGCGRCCLSKLEDIDTGAIAFTCVACTLLDPSTARCRDYPNRFARVPDCLAITPKMARTSTWLPSTCAYTRLARGEGLAWWHPLVSGTPQTVIDAGISVARRVISEDQVEPQDLEGFIANWPDEDPESPDDYCERKSEL